MYATKRSAALIMALALTMACLAGCKATETAETLDSMTRQDALIYRQEGSMSSDMCIDGVSDPDMLKATKRSDVIARWGAPDSSQVSYYNDYNTDTYVWSADDWSYGYVVQLEYKLAEFDADSESVKPSWIRATKLSGVAGAGSLPSLDDEIDLDAALAQPECWLALYVKGRSVADLEAMFGEAATKSDEPYGSASFKKLDDTGMVRSVDVVLGEDGNALYCTIGKAWADLDATYGGQEPSGGMSVGTYVPGVADDLVPDEYKERFAQQGGESDPAPDWMDGETDGDAGMDGETDGDAGMDG